MSDQARETAERIISTGEALSATNVEIRKLAQAYLKPSSSDLVKALEWLDRRELVFAKAPINYATVIKDALRSHRGEK